MGCKLSKAATDVATIDKVQTTTTTRSPESVKKTDSKDSVVAGGGGMNGGGGGGTSGASIRARKVKAKANDRVYKLLVAYTTDSESSSSSCWDEHAVLSAITPEAAAYRHPNTQATPLHVGVHLMNQYHRRSTTSTANTGSSSSNASSVVVTVLSELIRAHPDALHTTDALGNIPLHYAIAPPFSASARNARSAGRDGDSTLTLPASTWKLRTSVVKLLLTSDLTECSAHYLMRHDVSFGGDDMTGCSPLYRVVQTMPDDYSSSHAPTLEYLHLILKAIVTASAASVATTTSSPPKLGQGTTLVGVGNRCDGDKPLALLYRRFTRQFDLAEKFFSGDNSRPEVVEHRRNYKTAAGNTWKTMEMLLKQQYQQHEPPELKTMYRTVHRAVQGETPPDLLRYIVETNAEDLTVADEAGNLPLHYAARYQRPTTALLAAHKYTSFPAFYSKYVMDELLYKYPEAASKPDAAGLFPLTLAVQSGKQWIGGGIKSLYDAYPEALQQIQLTEHPALRRALSMDHQQQHVTNGDGNDTPVAPTDDDDAAAVQTAMDIIRDEQHDAIMLVQDETTDGYDVAISMWSHEEDAGVAMLGCVAISRLLVKQPSMNDCLRIALTALPAVVNAMKAHPNEVIVQEKACHALQAMAAVDGQREVSFVASGAVAAIVGAMQAHVSDPGVQEQACGALGRILHFGGSERATVIASVSGVTALINALAAHPAVQGVQRDACRALSELTAYQDVANLPDLPRHQAEPLLQAALRTWPDDCTETVTTLLSRLS